MRKESFQIFVCLAHEKHLVKDHDRILAEDRMKQLIDKSMCIVGRCNQGPKKTVKEAPIQKVRLRGKRRRLNTEQSWFMVYVKNALRH